MEANSVGTGRVTQDTGIEMSTESLERDGTTCKNSF